MRSRRGVGDRAESVPACANDQCSRIQQATRLIVNASVDQFLVIALVALGLPLVSFVLILFNQRAIGERAHLIAMPIMAFDLALVLYIAWLRLKTGFAALPAQEWSVDWLRLGNIPGFGPQTMPMSIMIDNLTAIMMVVVVGVIFLVHMFSIASLRRDVR